MPAAALSRLLGVLRLILLLRCLDDALELLRAFGPDERSRMLVVAGDVVQQEFFQSLGVVHTLSQGLLAQDTEEAFHHVDPGSMGRSVMEVHAGMPLQPVPHRLVLVNVEIVENHVQLALRKGGNDVLEEAKKVERSAALLDVGYHLATGELQRRQQDLGSECHGGHTHWSIGPSSRFLALKGDRAGAVKRLNAGGQVHNGHCKLHH